MHCNDQVESVRHRDSHSRYQRKAHVVRIWTESMLDGDSHGLRFDSGLYLHVGLAFPAEA